MQSCGSVSKNHTGNETAIKNTNLSDTEIKEILGYTIKR